MKDGRALVSLSNLDPDAEQTVELDLRGGSVQAAEGTVLAAASAAAHNTVDDPDAVRPVAVDVDWREDGVRITLPPHSFATVTLTLAGS